MKRIIVTEPDEADIGAALTDAGATVQLVARPITTSVLEQARIGETDIFVLTDPAEAIAIPILREIQPDVRIVVYAGEGLPDFASHQADLVLSPTGLEQDVVVEALLE